MKKALFGIMACLALFSLVLTGCDDLLGAVKGKDVEKVTLSDTTLTISVGENKTLTATITPADADNKTITWSSSNTDVATVNEGVVLGKAIGTATITAKSADGPQDNCTVNVAEDGGGDNPGTNKDPNGSKDTGTNKDPNGSKDTGTNKDPNGGGDNPGTNKVPNGGKDTGDSKDPNGGKDTGNSKDPSGSTGEDDIINTDNRKVETTLTINGIPSDAKGQNYQFFVFPSGKEIQSLNDSVASSSGTITGPTLSGTIHSEKPLSGDYTGVVIVGSRSNPVYVGYADITIRNGTTSISIEAFEAVTDEYIKNQSSNHDTGFDPTDKVPVPDQEIQATITVSGIRSDLVGKFCQLELFPHGTSVDNMSALPLAFGGVASIPSSMTLISIRPIYEEGKTPWNGADGSYVIRIMIIEKADDSLAYMGYVPVYLTNKTASIGFSDFIDILNGSFGPGDAGSELTGGPSF